MSDLGTDEHMIAPQVSVIVPCYRQAKYLSECVNSLLSQTFPNIEIIVVNDGSDDDTNEVANSYRSALTLIEKTNGGPNSARNCGLDVARGDWVLFLDADDVLHPNALECLMRSASPDRNIVIGQYKFFDEKIDFKESPDVVITERDLLASLLNENFAPIHSFLTPLSAFHEVGKLREDFWRCEDWEFWWRLAVAGYKASYIPEIVAYYRRVLGSNGSCVQKMTADRARLWLIQAESIARNHTLLNKLGSITLSVGIRVHRRLVLQCNEAPLIQLVEDKIIELLSLVKSDRKCSTSRRLMEGLVGFSRSERICVELLKWLRPSAIANYRNGFA